MTDLNASILKKKDALNTSVIAPEMADNEIILKQFAANRAILDFGNVKPGESIMRSLKIFNPSNRDYNIKFEKISTKEGFTVRELDWAVPANCTNMEIPIFWTPKGDIAAVSGQATIVWNSLPRETKLLVRLRGCCTITNPKQASNSKSAQLDRSFLKRARMDTSVLETNKTRILNNSVVCKTVTRKPLADLSMLNAKNDEKLEQHLQHERKMQKVEDTRKKMMDKRKEKLKWHDSLDVDVQMVQRELERVIQLNRNLCSQEDRRLSSTGLFDTSMAYFNCEKISILLQWCQAVCATYGIALESFNFIYANVDQTENVLKLISNFYQPKPMQFGHLFPNNTVASMFTRYQFKLEEPSSIEPLGEQAWNITFNASSSNAHKNINQLKTDEQLVISKVAEQFNMIIKNREKQLVMAALLKVQAVGKMKYQRKRYVALKRLVLQSQQLYRQVNERLSFIHKRNAVIDLQCLARMNLEASNNGIFVTAKSAIHLQSAYRRSIEMRNWYKLRFAAALCSAFYRKKHTREHEKERMEALRQLRPVAESLKQRNMFKCLKKVAAIKLQAKARKMIAQHDFLDFKFVKVVPLQNIVKKTSEQKEMQKLRKNTIELERLSRSTSDNREFEAIRAATTTLQTLSRTKTVTKVDGKQRDAVVSLAALARAKQEVTTFVPLSHQCLRLQAIARSAMQQDLFQLTQHVSKSVQAISRGKDDMYTFAQQQSIGLYCQAFASYLYEQSLFNKVQQTSVKLQSMNKSKKARARYLVQRKSATIIQQSYRNFHSRKLVLNEQKLLQSQAMLHSYKDVIRMKELRASTSSLQTQGRASLAQYLFNKQKKRALSLQSMQHTRVQQAEMNSLRASVKDLQCLVRACQDTTRQEIQQSTMAALDLQCLFHMNEDMSQSIFKYGSYRKCTNACTTIQKVFRGYMVRKQNQAQVTEIAKRLAKLSETVDERKQLGYRTQVALHILLTSKNMNQVMEAMCNLDTTTKYSPKCCDSCLQKGAIPIIFSVMKACNRSEPHVKLLKHALNVLIHLSANPYTVHGVFDCKDSLSILVEQMQMYRDNADVFKKALHIVHVLAQGNVSRLKRIKSEKKLVERLQKIADALNEKCKLLATLVKHQKNVKSAQQAKQVQEMRDALNKMLALLK